MPGDVLAPLVGPGLEIDSYDDWVFLAIAMVQTRGLRPKGRPAWLGRDFFLSGYRVFTRFVRAGNRCSAASESCAASSRRSARSWRT